MFSGLQMHASHNNPKFATFQNFNLKPNHMFTKH